MTFAFNPDVIISVMITVVTRMENGWMNDKHPMVLMFVGGTGLGKYIYLPTVVGFIVTVHFTWDVHSSHNMWSKSGDIIKQCLISQ